MGYGWVSGYTANPPLVSAIGPTKDRAALREAVVTHALTGDLELPEDELKKTVELARKSGMVSAALEGVLDAVDTAETVLIEHAYYDLDTRSEEAWSLPRQFRFAAIEQDRLHFFSIEVTKERFEAALSDPAAEAGLQKGYLGYTIFRQDNPSGIVGRTLVTPPLQSPRLADPTQMVSRIRTRVREHLTLAGLQLSVEGVPFMQQDGAVTRCAHAAAWMAHYTAVLHGVTPRVPVAALHSPVQGGTASLLRQYPSPGLTDLQLEMALANGGLPPELRLISEIAVEKRDEWYHRKELSRADNHVWHKEAFSAAVCRYLNSGMPVLLAQGDHVQVVTGYLREKDLVGAGDGGSVVSFTVADDRLGPYIIVDIDDLLWRQQPGDLLVVPMPPGLSLQGDVAEGLGASFFRSVIDQMLSDETASVVVKSSLTNILVLVKSKQLALRSYAVESNQFKESFAGRCTDRVAVSVMSAARLPKYVWVVEMIERSKRGGDSEANPGPVLGEVVLDGTAVSLERAVALVVHVGAYITVFDVVSTEEAGFECESMTYQSGRWGHGHHAMGIEWSPRIAKTSGAYSVG